MTLPPLLQRFLPFLRWLPYAGTTLRADFIAGLTVALVLVPQSMAYAQLAGMPPYYGLYASFLPIAVAALWGSSNQLSTAPVAVVALHLHLGDAVEAQRVEQPVAAAGEGRVPARLRRPRDRQSVV